MLKIIVFTAFEVFLFAYIYKIQYQNMIAPLEYQNFRLIISWTRVAYRRPQSLETQVRIYMDM